MANKSSPVFPMPSEPQHFSDYGFDPQMDYLQMLEEARKHKREITEKTTTSTTTRSSSTDQALHFKLQKPISKEDSTSSSSTSKKKMKNKKNKWWRNALVFWRWKWNTTNSNLPNFDDENLDIHHHRHMMRNNHHRAAAAYRGGTISGPVYITESRSGSSTPCRSAAISRPTSGPISSITNSSNNWNHHLMTPNRKGEAEISYVSLKELNLDHHQLPTDNHRISTSAMPIYLVT